MKRIVVGFMSTLSALVLLFSYHTSLGGSSTAAAGEPNANSGTDATSPGTTTSDGTTSGTDSGTDSGTGSGSTDSGSTGSSSGTSKSVTYTGDSVDTRWGPVQVAITVENGKITKSEAVVYPTENGRDQQINAYAVPALNQEAVQAQSSQIDALSGATVTSDGYIQSLQSAIDQAGL